MISVTPHLLTLDHTPPAYGHPLYLRGGVFRISTNYQLSSINYHLSSINYQLSSVIYHLSSVNRLSKSGSSMLRFFALKLMPMSVTGRLSPDVFEPSWFKASERNNIHAVRTPKCKLCSCQHHEERKLPHACFINTCGNLQ